jgi:hypothetical protein
MIAANNSVCVVVYERAGIRICGSVFFGKGFKRTWTLNEGLIGGWNLVIV